MYICIRMCICMVRPPMNYIFMKTLILGRTYKVIQCTDLGHFSIRISFRIMLPAEGTRVVRKQHGNTMNNQSNH